MSRRPWWKRGKYSLLRPWQLHSGDPDFVSMPYTDCIECEQGFSYDPEQHEDEPDKCDACLNPEPLHLCAAERETLCGIAFGRPPLGISVVSVEGHEAHDDSEHKCAECWEGVAA